MAAGRAGSDLPLLHNRAALLPWVFMMLEVNEEMVILPESVFTIPPTADDSSMKVSSPQPIKTTSLSCDSFPNDYYVWLNLW